MKGLTEKIKRSVIIVSTAWCPELQNNKDNEKNHSANSIALTASTTMLTSPAIVTLPRNSYTSLCKHNVQVNHHSLSSEHAIKLRVQIALYPTLVSPLYVLTDAWSLLASQHTRPIVESK
jgi:hypothetical protein|tara:strand:+ start:1175 stop:1534 length:360 start_codon:yes stop_codon:yes gene_type:complete